MFKSISLFLLLITVAHSAPAESSKTSPKKPIPLNRPTPINPDIISDPKPPERIIMIDPKELHTKQKRQAEDYFTEPEETNKRSSGDRLDKDVEFHQNVHSSGKRDTESILKNGPKKDLLTDSEPTTPKAKVGHKRTQSTVVTKDKLQEPNEQGFVTAHRIPEHVISSAKHERSVDDNDKNGKYHDGDVGHKGKDDGHDGKDCHGGHDGHDGHGHDGHGHDGHKGHDGHSGHGDAERLRKREVPKQGHKDHKGHDHSHKHRKRDTGKESENSSPVPITLDEKVIGIPPKDHSREPQKHDKRETDKHLETERTQPQPITLGEPILVIPPKDNFHKPQQHDKRETEQQPEERSQQPQPITLGEPILVIPPTDNSHKPQQHDKRDTEIKPDSTTYQPITGAESVTVTTPVGYEHIPKIQLEDSYHSSTRRSTTEADQVTITTPKQVKRETGSLKKLYARRSADGKPATFIKPLPVSDIIKSSAPLKKYSLADSVTIKNKPAVKEEDNKSKIKSDDVKTSQKESKR